MIWLILLSIAFTIMYLVPMPILLFTPKEAAKLRWLDKIYGNRVDGTGWNFGTSKYITMSGFTGAVGKVFPRYAWLVLRNPFNNLLRNMGPYGIVEAVSYTGRWRTNAQISGKQYFLIHIKKYWRTGSRYSELKFGYKLWDDIRTGSKLEIGHHFENSVAFSLQPWRRS